MYLITFRFLYVRFSIDASYNMIEINVKYLKFYYLGYGKMILPTGISLKNHENNIVPFGKHGFCFTAV